MQFIQNIKNYFLKPWVIVSAKRNKYISKTNHNDTAGQGFFASTPFQQVELKARRNLNGNWTLFEKIDHPMRPTGWLAGRRQPILDDREGDYVVIARGLKLSEVYNQMSEHESDIGSAVFKLSNSANFTPENTQEINGKITLTTPDQNPRYWRNTLNK